MLLTVSQDDERTSVHRTSAVARKFFQEEHHNLTSKDVEKQTLKSKGKWAGVLTVTFPVILGI